MGFYNPNAGPARFSPGVTFRTRSDRRARGFTLIELLVAAAITALMAGFIAAIVRGVATTWTRSAGRLGADAQARFALDQLQLDLEGALYRDDGRVWFAADIIDHTSNAGELWVSAPGLPKPTGTGAHGSVRLTSTNIARARFGTAGVWLRFFTSSRGTNLAARPATTSAPVAIGYQIVRRSTATNANRNASYLLHRAEVRPAADAGRPGVIESGYDLSAGPYTIGGETNTGAITGDPRRTQRPGTNGEGDPNLDDVLAENVIDFGIRCYVRDATRPGALRLVFPADSAGRPGGGANARYRAALPSRTPTAEWGDRLPFPEVVDVMIRVLSREGATLIARVEAAGMTAVPVPRKYNGNAHQWWWGIAQEHSRVHIRRVVVQAVPP